MIRMRNGVALLLILTLPVALPALAEGGYIEDFKRDLEGSTNKLLQLAEATPAEGFGWRPAEGVRSVGEVFIHSPRPTTSSPVSSGSRCRRGWAGTPRKRSPRRARSSRC